MSKVKNHCQMITFWYEFRNRKVFKMLPGDADVTSDGSSFHRLPQPYLTVQQ